jgi:hypothetical protein
MRDESVIRFLGRMICYMLLLTSLIFLIYTLANQMLTAATIFLVVSAIILYFGLIRIRIPANSVAVRNGKVVYCIPEKSVRNRLDFYTRGQTIVELPHFNLLDRPYKLEIVSPDTEGGVTACRLTITLGYIMDMEGLQRAYDNYIRHPEKLSLVVKKELLRSASRMAFPYCVPGEAEREEYLKPVIVELGRALGPLGLMIKEATCTVTVGQTVVHLVTTEQEMMEQEAAMI